VIKKAQKRRTEALRNQIAKLSQPGAPAAIESPNQFVQRRMAEIAKADARKKRKGQ
jgi:hypothetical protein